MVHVQIVYARRRLWGLGPDEEVRIACEVREIVWLDRPIGKVQLAGSEVCEHTGKVVVHLVDQIVYIGSVGRPVVVTVGEDCVNSW